MGQCGEMRRKIAIFIFFSMFCYTVLGFKELISVGCLEQYLAHGK
jgi:hypothetical protein